MGTEGKYFAINVDVKKKKVRKERTQTLPGATNLLTSHKYTYWLLVEGLLFPGQGSPAPPGLSCEGL